MSFTRRPSDKWNREVPGARWFRADLHIHSIDDRAGKRAVLPCDLPEISNAEYLTQYARSLLRAACSSRIEVLALTPHSPFHGDDQEMSAVWAVVDEWNTGTDDDGVPFRERIYAVFPGFEPSFDDGRSGLHILFLFDPEIGKSDYLGLFQVIMGGAPAWKDSQLQLSLLSFPDAIRRLRKFRRANDRAALWNHIALAPHIDSDKGLLDTKKAQVLERFPHEEIAGLELGGNKLPDDVLANRTWLEDGIHRYRQAFFHSSDAYSITDIGHRFTWFKLASPRIDALRQAMLAPDSRVRLAFRRAADGPIERNSWSPEVDAGDRPWLREVGVRGDAAFFGRGAGTTFRLNPDLTCVIGGSMTGKSTFLDGLRVRLGASMPENQTIRAQVEARGRDVFAAGSPMVHLDCQNSDPTAKLQERWPAQFFAQNELQRLAEQGSALEDILGRLAPGETAGIERRRVQMTELDTELRELAEEIGALTKSLADAEQAHDRARGAAALLKAFAAVGAERLARMDQAQQLWTGLLRDAGRAEKTTREAATALAEIEVPHGGGPDPHRVLEKAGLARAVAEIEGRRNEIGLALESIHRDQEGWTRQIRTVADRITELAADIHAEVQAALAARGHDAGKLREFQDLRRQAGLLRSYEASYARARRALGAKKCRFDEARRQRAALMDEQRSSFDRVAHHLQTAHEDRLRVVRLPHGDYAALEKFVLGLRERGITRWWNDLSEEERRAAAGRLHECDEAVLGNLGMSKAVRTTFSETMSERRRLALRAMRHPDEYEIHYRTGDGGWRPLPELSGGQRVSVLLSLLLRANDPRPLVIDQPEDELDTRVLFDTVLPALRALKGRRQVIVATHDANIVVNGDADMVILLEADARHGRVACAGAIEMPEVRDAIVKTVDGGKEAFRLRRTK